MADPILALERRLYRAAIALCPPSFRREYAGEMIHDFDDARAEASQSGRLWRVRVQMTLDLLRTIGVQWARTGLPLLCVVSMLIPLVAVESLVRLAARARFTIPPEVDQPELLGLLILTVTSLFVIATTIAMTLWASRPVRRTRR